MSSLDSLFLYLDNDVSPMHLGVVAILDGPVPETGEFAGLVAGKLALLERYRQRVRWVPWGLGPPVWVDDPHFDLSYHVRRTALPHPGGAAELRVLVGRVMSQPLDLHRPLWEMWVIEGLGAGRWGLICKLHHCMVDGISAGEVLGVLLDVQPAMSAPVPDRWEPQPEPSSARVMMHALSERASGPARHVREAGALLGAPRQMVRQAVTLAGGANALSELLGASPARSLNGPLSSERLWVQTQAALADVKAIRRALGGTVNDVLLTAVSGGFRALLEGRGEPLPAELTVRTLVPLSIRTHDGRGTPDNRVSALFAELPIGITDPTERLRAITIELDGLKRSGQATAASTFTQLPGLAPPPLVALGAGALAHLHQHQLQTVITNIPGPQQPLYLCGRLLCDLFPYVPLALDVRIGVAISSYNGTLGIGITGDGEHASDISTLADAVAPELVRLLRAAAPTRPHPTLAHTG